MATQEDKLKAVEKLAEKLNEKKSSSGSMVIVAGKNQEKLKPKVVPCNVPALNKALGGGFARGAMHLLSGTPGGGKTAIALSVAKNCIDRGEIAIYVCTEPPFPWGLVNELNINKDFLIVMEPDDYGEQLIDSIYDLLYDPKTRQPRGLLGCIVWDSLNNTIPKKAIDRAEEKGSDAAGMADRAGMFTYFLERLQGRGMLRSSEGGEGVVTLLIAQLRANLSGYGDSDMISGGKAPQFNCKTVVRLRHKITAVTKNNVSVPTHQDVFFTVSKNNILGKPTAGVYRYDYTDGLDDTKGLVEQALDLGLITKNGKKIYVFSQYGKPSVESELKRDEIEPYLRNNSEIKELLLQAVNNIDGEFNKVETLENVSVESEE